MYYKRFGKKFLSSIEEVLVKIFFYLIRFYQVAISPFFGKKCRHIPSCSEYALMNLKINGLKGVSQIIFRVLKCNPFFSATVDFPKKLKE